MLDSNFVILASIIASVGGFSYLLDTIKGKVKPNRVSFLMWSIAPLIAFAAQLQQGVGIEALLTFSAGIIPLVVFFASFVNKEAEWKISKFDIFCGSFSLIGVILWLVTKQGNLAIAFSILADAAASAPTILKSYKHPETEAAWPYFASTIGAVITLLTLKQITFSNAGFVVYLLLVTLVIFILVQFKIGKKTKK